MIFILIWILIYICICHLVSNVLQFIVYEHVLCFYVFFVGTKKKLGGVFMCAKQSQKNSMQRVNLLTKQPIMLSFLKQIRWILEWPEGWSETAGRELHVLHNQDLFAKFAAL